MDYVRSIEEEKNRIVNVKKANNKFLKSSMGLSCVGAIGFGLVGSPFFQAVSIGVLSSTAFANFTKKVIDIIRLNCRKRMLDKIATQNGVDFKLAISEDIENSICKFVSKDGSDLSVSEKEKIDRQIMRDIIYPLNDKKILNDGTFFPVVSCDYLEDIFYDFGGFEGIKLITGEYDQSLEENNDRNLSDEFLEEISNRLVDVASVDNETYQSELSMYLMEYEFTENDFNRLKELIESKMNPTIEDEVKIQL